MENNEKRNIREMWVPPFLIMRLVVNFIEKIKIYNSFGDSNLNNFRFPIDTYTSESYEIGTLGIVKRVSLENVYTKSLDP